MKCGTCNRLTLGKKVNANVYSTINKYYWGEAIIDVCIICWARPKLGHVPTITMLSNEETKAS